MITTTKPEDLLGMGLYTPPEAAMYARLATQTMTRWIHGSSAGERVLRPQTEGEDEKIVTFLDFVQALAIHAIRSQHKVSLQKIREAVDRASEKYGVHYPLARDHMTYLYQGDLFIVWPESAEEDLVQVTGQHKDQVTLRKIIELYVRDLTFNKEGLAATYVAFARGNYQVLMDPGHRFGEPMVTSCDYTAQVLWEASKSEGSIEAAADIYGVNVEEVEVACRYHDYLQGKATAA